MGEIDNCNDREMDGKSHDSCPSPNIYRPTVIVIIGIGTWGGGPNVLPAIAAITVCIMFGPLQMKLLPMPMVIHQ